MVVLLLSVLFLIVTWKPCTHTPSGMYGVFARVSAMCLLTPAWSKGNSESVRLRPVNSMGPKTKGLAIFSWRAWPNSLGM